MKISNILFLLLTVCGALNAQQFEREFHGRSKGYVNTLRFHIDKSGNHLVPMGINDSTDVDPGPGTSYFHPGPGNKSILVKYDSLGGLIWARAITGNTTADEATIRDLNSDEDRNIYITGSFSGTVDFDPGAGSANLTASGVQDFFICKYDSNGNYLWGHRFGSPGGVGQIEAGHGIGVDSLGACYVTGFIRGTTDFDPGPGTVNLTPIGTKTTFLMKLSTAGTYEWAFLLENGQSRDIVVNEAGSSTIVAEYFNTIDVDPGPGTQNIDGGANLSLLVAQYDASGNLVWAQTEGGASPSAHIQAQGIEYDMDGNVVVSGRFREWVDFDPGSGYSLFSAIGSYDCFIAKYDAAGNFSWATHLGSPQIQEATGIDTDLSGNVYSIGFFYEFLTLDTLVGGDTLPGRAGGLITPYVVKFSPAGSNIWAFKFETTASHYTRDLHFASPSSFYMHYYAWTDSIDLDPGVTAYHVVPEVAYPAVKGIIKYGTPTICVASVSSINPIACENYLSPSGIYLWDSTGTYQDTVQNAGGCDSVITVNLTINDASTSAIAPSVCYSYTSPSGNHVWDSSGTYTDTLMNASGCDSVITVNLTINEASASAIAPAVCYSYTSPSGNHVWDSSGTYLDTLMNAVGCDSLITVDLTINQATSNSIAPIECDSFISPSGKYVWFATGVYMDTISNSAGCDSVVTVNLTIPIVDTTVIDNSPTLTANQFGLDYQWLNCDSGFAPIPGDTNMAFTATSSGNYAVEVSLGACRDTSNCHSVIILVEENNPESNSFNLFPNPNKGQFNLELKSGYSVETFQVFNALGELVWEEKLMSKSLVIIDLQDLSAGIYQGCLTGRHSRECLKIIIRK